MMHAYISTRRAEARAILRNPASSDSLRALAARFLLQWGVF
jgi:hypothetical protein